jgi:hypothetical protein
MSAAPLSIVKRVASIGALLALCALLLAACAGDDAVPADTGVKGTVEMAGGPPEADGPLPDLTIEVRKESEEGAVAATGRSDADGAFTIAVPAGDYFVVALYKDGTTAEPAAVTTGVYTTVELQFKAK